MDPQEELVRLLAIQVEVAFDTQAEAFTRVRKRAGFGPTRFAELLGTTPGTVNVTLVKGRESRGTKQRPTKKKSPARAADA